METGFAVYADNFKEKDDNYYQEAFNLGYRVLFSSLHLPESNIDKEMELFRNFIRREPLSSFKIIVDIDKQSFKKLKEHGDIISAIDGIRVDLGFTASELVREKERFPDLNFVLNASLFEEAEIEVLNEEKGFGEAWHNFYPRPETGLPLDFFREKNHILRKNGFMIGGFIPANTSKRGPLFEGLPTLEHHRNRSSGLNFRELKALKLDRIIFGDPLPSVEELREVAGYSRDNCIELRIDETLENSETIKKLLYEKPHQVRRDPSPNLIRSATSRGMAAFGEKIPPGEVLPRLPYSVTVDNEKYRRYSGELQVTRDDFPADERVNVVARIIAEDRPLVELLEPGDVFRLLPNK